MTQYERRLKSKNNKKHNPKPTTRYNATIHKMTYKSYRMAYARWKQAISRGNDVQLQLFLDNPKVKLHIAKPKAYYYAKRALQVALATPKWVNIEEISNIYANRPEGYHVDHIVPINGKNQCGLNVPWNLQYLPAKQNYKKSNK